MSRGTCVAGEEKNFPVLRLRLEKFLPTLDAGGVLRHPQNRGNGLSVPLVPLGAEGEKRGGFSLFGRHFLFCYPLQGVGKREKGGYPIRTKQARSGRSEVAPALAVGLE